MTSTMTVARVVNYTLRTYTQAESEMTSVERVLHFALNLPREDYLSKLEGEEANSPLHDTVRTQRGAAVKFDQVSFRYRVGLPLVLRDVSFQLPCGSKTGFVGRSGEHACMTHFMTMYTSISSTMILHASWPTGAGKSSIVHSILRLSELRGECGQGMILFDERDISTMGLADLRQRVSVCPQDCVLFGGTVRSNIDPCDYYDAASVARVLEQVNLVQQLGGIDGNAFSVLDRTIAECGSGNT
jgi:ABC-type multidrug transport system fused ATPase/permease subunit